MNENLVTLIKHAVEDSKTNVCLTVPGLGATELNESINSSSSKIYNKVSLNEEAALSVTMGASIYGTRSCTFIKSHGLAKACNALMTSLSIGVNASNLIFVLDDVDGKSSDNILDTMNLIKGTEAPFVKIGDNAYEQILDAVMLSERMKLPVLIYVNCDNLFNEYSYTRVKINEYHEKFIRNPYLNVACPLLSAFQRKILINKLQDKTIDTSVVELPRLSNLENILPNKLKDVFIKYKSFFNVFKKIDRDYTSGDTGTSALFAFEPYDCIDTCSYMGGSPGMAVGAYLAGAKKSWSITGDFTFFSAGVLGLTEAKIKSIPIKLVIFNNGFAGATGGQLVDEILIEEFRLINKSYITEIYTEENEEQILNKLLKVNNSKQLQIVIVNV